jgi:hypothetical protein
MTLTALQTTKLRIELSDAIEHDKRARKGSDKTYKRECKQRLIDIRNRIVKLTNDQRQSCS